MNQHYIEQIHADHEALNPAARHHIESCSDCRSELEIMQRLTAAITHLPQHSAPSRLKYLVLQSLARPVYRVWHFLLLSLIMMVSPLLVDRFTDFYQAAPRFSLMVLLISELFAAALMIPVVLEVASRYNGRVLSLMDHFDRRFTHPD